MVNRAVTKARPPPRRSAVRRQLGVDVPRAGVDIAPMETGAEHTDGPGETKRFGFMKRFFHGGLTAATTGKTHKNLRILWSWMDLDGYR